ncbi:MAG: ABC transporter substrate-binding protein [Holophaga sp.]|nr:ABC transporter substrate-binding protein [Holophaga sp.]
MRLIPSPSLRTAFRAVVAAAFLCCAAARAGDHLKVGYLPVTGHAKFFVAKEYGLFAKEGLDVELIEFQNSADGLAALRAGKLDLGSFGTTAPLVHIAKGANLRIIGGVMGEDAAIITTTAKASGVKSVSDLRGKKIATIRLATGDAVLRGALERVHINWKKDVQIFELKSPPAVMEAVKSGQVDAGVIWGPFDQRLEEQGLKVVIRSKALSPGHPCCRLTVDEKSLATNPAVWERFIRAFLLAEKFTRDHHPETIAALAKYVKLDPALLAKAYYSDNLDQASDPNVKGVSEFWATMQSSEFIDAKQSIRPYIDTAVYKKALDGLAREYPKEPYWKHLQQVFAQRDT